MGASGSSAERLRALQGSHLSFTHVLSHNPVLITIRCHQRFSEIRTLANDTAASPDFLFYLLPHFCSPFGGLELPGAASVGLRLPGLAE